MALLGMTITAVELVTALPYFAATTLMTLTRLPAVQWLPLLLVYNAIFAAPPLLLLGLHVLLGRHLGDRYPRWRMTMQRGAREATLWIVAIVGVALSGDAIGRYLGNATGGCTCRPQFRADGPWRVFWESAPLSDRIWIVIEGMDRWLGRK